MLLVELIVRHGVELTHHLLLVADGDVALRPYIGQLRRALVTELVGGQLLTLISPRLCVVCGQRLTISEEIICSRCNLHLPRTGFQKNPYENEMAKLFWHQIPIERTTALFYYESHSETANILYELKYKNHPEIGEVMGRMMARELQASRFFDAAIQGKHLLIIDDVVTTGATVLACAKELCKASNVKVSVIALGFAKS